MKVELEVARCREKGLALIPKLNFATTHSFRLGEYRNMTSTNTYYKVVNDLIHEVYELFDHPEYIHFGMDEQILGYQTAPWCATRWGNQENMTKASSS